MIYIVRCFAANKETMRATASSNVISDCHIDRSTINANTGDVKTNCYSKTVSSPKTQVHHHHHHQTNKSTTIVQQVKENPAKPSNYRSKNPPKNASPNTSNLQNNKPNFTLKSKDLKKKKSIPGKHCIREMNKVQRDLTDRRQKTPTQEKIKKVK